VQGKKLSLRVSLAARRRGREARQARECKETG